MVYGKTAKGLPPLRRPKPSKKSQEKEDKIKKLYEANMCWNYWKSQLYWHKLEWVNPRSQIKGKTLFSLFNFYKNKGDRTSHWVGDSKLKELDINDFFERKQIIEDMESELTEAPKNIQILTIRWWLKRQMLMKPSLQKPRPATRRKLILKSN